MLEWWSRVWIREGRRLPWCDGDDLSARVIEMLHPAGVVVLLMTPECVQPWQLGFAMCVPIGGRKRDILSPLVPFGAMDKRDFSMGEAFVRLRLLLDVFPVSCYMKKEAK